MAQVLKSIGSRVLQWTALAVCAAWLSEPALFAQSPNFASITTTTNATGVGQALDNVAPASTGSVLGLINTVTAGTSFQQQQALNQLSGEVFGSTQTIGLQIGDQFQQRVGARLINNGRFLAGKPACQSDDEDDDDTVAPLTSTNAWVQAYGVGGSLHSDGNAAGVRYSQGGGIYGIDLAGDETGVIGVSGGNAYIGFDDGLGGVGQVDAYQAGVYALKHNDLAYVLGTIDYGHDSFRTTRNIQVVSVNQSLSSSFASQQFGTYIESGLKLHAGWVHLQPLVALQYLFVDQPGFSETGGSAALNVASNQANSLRTHLGGRLIVDQLTAPGGSVWTPYWQLRWVSELLDNDRTVDASFVGSPAGGAFQTHGTRLGQNYLIFGKGLQAQLTDNWSFFGNVDLMANGRIRTESLALGLVYGW